jgi:hypothetical protein
VLEHAINLTEEGSTVDGIQTLVWTGTKPTGEATAFHCNGWTNGGAQQFGTLGDCTQVTPAWTELLLQQPLLNCTTQARLYCFEQ